MLYINQIIFCAQLAQLRRQRLEKLSKVQKEIKFAKRRKERTNNWLQETRGIYYSILSMSYEGHQNWFLSNLDKKSDVSIKYMYLCQIVEF